MNKIVREHYPSQKLPEDLRPEGSNDAWVTVTITPEANDGPLTALQAVALARAAQNLHVGPKRSMEEIVAEIRELRDEWDD